MTTNAPTEQDRLEFLDRIKEETLDGEWTPTSNEIVDIIDHMEDAHD